MAVSAELARGLLSLIDPEIYYHDCEADTSVYETFDIDTTTYGQYSTYLTLSPNPAGQAVNCTATDPPSGTLTIRVYDLYGILQIEEEIPQNENELELDISGLPQAIYVVSLWINEDILDTKQLIIIRY